MGISEKIQQILDLEDMKQSVLARKVGVKDTRFTKWKKPRKIRTYPNAPLTLKIARVLGVSMEFLADDERTMDSLADDRLEREILRQARAIGLDVALEKLKAKNEIRFASEGDGNRRRTNG